MEKEYLISNINLLHTTTLGAERIKRNLSLDTNDVVLWCKDRIVDSNSKVEKNGKNWYVRINNCVITINTYSYTIITAHKIKKKKIAFICVHNSCRSQIAEALAKKYISDRYDIYSAGTDTSKGINKDAIRLIKEKYDIDMSLSQKSKLITNIPKVDIVITMGCNVSCPNISCSERYDWGLDDPSGKSDEEFMLIINKIEEKILKL